MSPKLARLSVSTSSKKADVFNPSLLVWVVDVASARYIDFIVFFEEEDVLLKLAPARGASGRRRKDNAPHALLYPRV